MRIAMIGSGYVGMVSGASFSHIGHHVTCDELDARKIFSLHVGVMPINTSRLKELVAHDERRAFSTDPAASVASDEPGLSAVARGCSSGPRPRWPGPRRAVLAMRSVADRACACAADVLSGVPHDG